MSTNLLSPTCEELSKAYTDIIAPVHGVDVSFSEDRRVLWINVDGVCVLRVCRIPHLEVSEV